MAVVVQTTVDHIVVDRITTAAGQIADLAVVLVVVAAIDEAIKRRSQTTNITSSLLRTL